jgi:integrase
MPTLKLTQIAVDRLKPAESRKEYWDSQLPGFGLRIAAARPGREPVKTWQAMYRVGGKLVRQKIGTLATIPRVDEAREMARASMLLAHKGTNPVDERRLAEAEERRRIESEQSRQRDTVGAVLDRYVQHKMTPVGNPPRPSWRPDTFKEVSRCFEVDVKPAIGTKPIRDVSRRDVRGMIDAIAERGRVPHAHHVLAYLRPAFAWAVEKDIIEVNPAAGIADPDPRKREDRTRDRYLNDDEIVAFWSGCEAIKWPFGPLFQLLLLSGQRRDELADARWREFDLDKALWTLPGERTKNGKGHIVHLAPLAKEIMGQLPHIGGAGYVFTTTGDAPVSGFGRARERLDAAMEQETGEKVPPFTLHDLRRSAATGMAKLHIVQEVVEKVLNHVSGKVSGVAAIYNRHDFLEERKAALEAWSRHVEGLVRPVPSNVADLNEARERKASA